MKTNVLFKEYPWIKDLHPLTSRAIHFRVSRLDMATLVYRSIGRHRLAEFPHNSYGFFVGREGSLIGTIHPEIKEGFLSRLLDQFRDPSSPRLNTTHTIEVAASQLHCNQIHGVYYIVIIVQAVHDSNDVSIELIKIPKEIGLYDLLKRVDHEREVVKKIA